MVTMTAIRDFSLLTLWHCSGGYKHLPNMVLPILKWILEKVALVIEVIENLNFASRSLRHLSGS